LRTGGGRDPCLGRLVRRVRVGLSPTRVEGVSGGNLVRARERGKGTEGEQVLDICLEVVLRTCRL
jgi:hypothetical protein